MTSASLVHSRSLEAWQSRQRWHCDALDIRVAHAQRSVVFEQAKLSQLQLRHEQHAQGLNQRRFVSMDMQAYQEGLATLLALQVDMTQADARLRAAIAQQASVQSESIRQQQRLTLFTQVRQRFVAIQKMQTQNSLERAAERDAIMRLQIPTAYREQT